MSLEQIEERLVKSVLSNALALHILRSSQKPTSKLVDELLEIEIQVGQFVGHAMQMHIENLKASNMEGMLANALSFVSLGGTPGTQFPLLPPRSMGDSTALRKRNRKNMPIKLKKKRPKTSSSKR